MSAPECGASGWLDGETRAGWPLTCGLRPHPGTEHYDRQHRAVFFDPSPEWGWSSSGPGAFPMAPDEGIVGKPEDWIRPPGAPVVDELAAAREDRARG